MQRGVSNPKADIVLAIAIILFSVVIYVAAMDLPPAHWEPLGSAALPQALSVIMALLSLYVMIRAIRALKTYAPAKAKQEEFQRRPKAAVGMFLLCVAYVGVMDLGILGFVEATIAFLMALCLLFTRAERKHIPWIIGFALVIAFGNFLIFTKFLYVDLPMTEWLWGGV